MVMLGRKEGKAMAKRRIIMVGKLDVEGRTEGRKEATYKRTKDGRKEGRVDIKKHLAVVVKRTLVIDVGKVKTDV
jgi:hypothetical protein